MFDPDPENTFHFHDPEFFIAGALGEPGRREFHLQTRSDGQIITVKCEKQHVMALAERLQELLADLPPVDEAAATAITAGLRQPIEAAWRAGGLSLVYDESTERVVIIIELLDRADHDAEQAPRLGRVDVTREQAAAFVVQAAELLSGSRPLCRLCGAPIDPRGHACPRANGKHRHP